MSVIPPQAPISPEEIPAGPRLTSARSRSRSTSSATLEVAAAGSHNVMLIGPPGAGKTLLAWAMPGILPRMTIDEALDVTRIYSVAD